MFGSFEKYMKLNKSPGNDGLNVEFNVLFWPVIVEVVVSALYEAFIKENLSSSKKHADITLISKDGKDPLQIKHHKPISLSNIEYKVLSSRMIKV